MLAVTIKNGLHSVAARSFWVAVILKVSTNLLEKRLP